MDKLWTSTQAIWEVEDKEADVIVLGHLLTSSLFVSWSKNMSFLLKKKPKALNTTINIYKRWKSFIEYPFQKIQNICFPWLRNIKPDIQI